MRQFSATDLANRTGDVLAAAAQAPVTIFASRKAALRRALDRQVREIPGVGRSEDRPTHRRHSPRKKARSSRSS